MFKRMLALLLVLAMVLTVLPLSALATDQTETETTESTSTEAPVPESSEEESSEAESEPEETTAPAYTDAEFTLTLQTESHASVAGKTVVRLMRTAAPAEAYIGSVQFDFVVPEGVEPQWMEGLQVEGNTAV